MSKKPTILITVSDDPTDIPERYIAVLEKYGATPVVVRPSSELPPLEEVDAILFSGGREDIEPARYGDPVDPRSVPPDLPRDRFEFDLCAEGRKRDLPMLGVCRGFQLLNVAFGGKLVQHVDNHASFDGVSGFHPIDVRPDTRLCALTGVCGPLPSNSRHHQAVKPEIVAPPMKVVAMSPDGLVEAIEAKDQRWVVGIQCHPERQTEVDPRWGALFADFVREAGGGEANIQARR